MWKYRKYREHFAMVQSSDESDFIFILWKEIPLPDQIIGSKNFTSKKVNFTIFSEFGNAKMIFRPLRRGFPGQSTYRTKQTISETVSTSVFHSRFNSPQILRENAHHLREKFKEIIRSPKFNSRSEAYVERFVIFVVQNW